MPQITPEQYEAFVSTFHDAFFHQSVNWSQVKSNWKRELLLSFDEQGNPVGSMLILIRTLPLFGYTMFYAPRGPVCDYHNKAVLKDLTDQALTLAKQYRACELCIDPPILEEDDEAIEILCSLGYSFEAHKPDFASVQLRATIVLNDIKGKTEEEVLASFKQKTRYNIRVAVKNGVECICSKDDKNLDDFYRLYQITGKRDDFLIRQKEYYRRLLDCMGQDARLYVCYYNEQAVSAAIAIHYANRTYYLFGASDNQYRNVMPNYLMQWSMIQWALENGSDTYDFMGIPVSEEEDVAMAGVYRFKRGFNGDKVVFAGEFTQTLKPFVYKMIGFGTRCYHALLRLKHRLSKGR